MKLRLLTAIQRWVDRCIASELKKSWTPSGDDCDASCSYCGYLCPGCGRP